MNLSTHFDIIKKSIEIFFEKKSFTFFIKVYLPLLPFALFSIVQSNFIKNVNDFKNPWIIAMTIFVNLGYLIVYFWISIAGIIAIAKVVRGQSLELRNVYRTSWNMLWKFSLLCITLFLIELGGILLLVIPAVIFGVWFSFSRFIFIENKLTIKEALKKSRELTRGKFWAILGRYLVFAIASMFFGVLLSTIPYGLGEIITTVFGALFVLPYYLLYRELVLAYKKK